MLNDPPALRPMKSTSRDSKSHPPGSEWSLPPSTAAVRTSVFYVRPIAYVRQAAGWRLPSATSVAVPQSAFGSNPVSLVGRLALDARFLLLYLIVLY